MSTQALPSPLPATHAGESLQPTNLGIVLLGLLIIMADGFDLQAIGFVAPEIARAWDMELAAFGPVFSAGLFGSMAGALIAGPAARRCGLVATLAVSLLLFGGLTLLSTSAASIWPLAALRFLIGVGLGAALPLVMVMVTEHSPRRFRATALVAAMCGQPIGAVLGSQICAWMMPVHGWQFAFWLGGLLPIVLAAALLALRGTIGGHRAAGAARPGETGTVGDLFGKDLRAITLAAWLVSLAGVFMLYLVVNWLPGSIRAAGYSLQASVSAISAFNVGGIAGALVLGPIIDRIGPFRAVGPLFALAPLALAALVVGHTDPTLIVVVSLVAGIVAYGAMISLGSVVTFAYPANIRATGVGWTLGVGRLGAALGPLAASIALALGLAVSNLFYIAAFAALFATIGIWLLHGATARARIDWKA